MPGLATDDPYPLTMTPKTRRPTHGANHTAAAAALADLDVDPAADPLGALVMTLADCLDNGAGSQTANLAREYRVALERLRAQTPQTDELDVFLANLRTPI